KVSVDQAAMNASAINAGRIEADGGTVILTARSANALLDTVVNNSGVIRANSLVERNGEIVLDGGSYGVVSTSGTLQATGVEVGTKGGTIRVVGDKVAVTGNALIDASGDAGGGAITVGGQASGTFVGRDSAMRADATRDGDGGVVTISSSEATRVHGAISARGAGDGKGGFVETSGRYLEVSRAPDVGAGGAWLIDPYNLIVTTVTSNNTGEPNFTPNGDDSQIDAGLIVSRLNSGANVILDTGGAGSAGTQDGDIRVNAPIEKTAANSASLTLKAFHDVEVNEAITISSSPPGTPSGPGRLRIEAGHDVVVAAPITTPGGALSITAAKFTNRSAISNGV